MVLPQRGAVGLGNGDNRRPRPPGVHQDAVAHTPRRFAVAPIRIAAAEPLDQVDRQDLLAGRALKTRQLAVAAERVETSALDSGRTARTIAAVVLVAAAVLILPDLLAGGAIERHDVLVAGAGAERVEPSAE